MFKNISLFVSGLLWWTTVQAQLPAQSFKTIDGKNFSFSNPVAGKGWVVFFLLPDCPMCQNYSLSINQLARDYNNKGFVFVAVFPGRAYSAKEMQAFLKTYKMSIAAITDPAFVLANALHATVTPQALLINPAGKTLYTGKIDNWMYAVGQKRQVVTEHYLKDALESVLQNKPVKNPRTEPVGCFIK